MLDLLRPNVAVLGYGLFLALNAAGIWGGVFPFLPLDFQTPSILFGFFLAQAIALAIGHFTEAVRVYRFVGTTARFSIVPAAVPYALGWFALIAAIYLDRAALGLTIAGGVLIGLGSAEFNLLWQELFSGEDPENGNRNLIAGTAYSAVFYAVLCLIPQAITVYLIPLVLLPLFGLAAVLKSRRIEWRQPMFDDVPREHANVYRQTVRDMWRPSLCIGIFGLCTGIVRSLAIESPQIGSLVNTISMFALFAAAIVMLALWCHRSLHFSIITLFKVCFPLSITAFAALPFLGMDYLKWLTAIFFALYSMATMFMVINCTQTARDRGVHPLFVCGVFGGIVYLLHDIGFIAGALIESGGASDIPLLSLITQVATYLLGLMFFLGQGGFSKTPGIDEAGRIELIALYTPQCPSPAHREDGCSTTGDTISSHRESFPSSDTHETSAHTLPSSNQTRPAFKDRISKQAEIARQRYRLSTRETEIMELIARGNSVAGIAELLVVSENTVRSHSKHIYAKLGIHKKQELVELLTSLNPSDLDD